MRILSHQYFTYKINDILRVYCHLKNIIFILKKKTTKYYNFFFNSYDMIV